MMKKLILPLLILAGSAGHAQRYLSVEEAIATALQNNYDIQLAQNDSIAAAIDYSYKNAALFPRLNANAGKLWNNNNQKQILADGTERKSSGLKSNNLSAQLALNWTLFDGFKMFATREKFAEFLVLGELGVKNQVVNTVSTVITLYYDIVRQKQEFRALQEQMGISEERVRLAKYKLDIGMGAKPDVLQSMVDLNAQKALQLEQRKLMDQLTVRLNQVMNIEPTTKYEVADSIPINQALSLGDIQQDVINKNPSLLIAQKNVDIAGLTLKERKADRFPVISFNSAYNFNRTNNQAVLNNFSTLFNQSRGLNYGFTATIPIFNNYIVRRQIRQAELDIQYQQLVYQNQRSLLDLSVLVAFTDYEQQKRALALEEENILLARENVGIVMEVYRLNSTTLIQLKEAQQSLQAAYTRLITARYNTKLAETELLRLSGDLVR
jgi:outer membrane protein TolC